MEDVKKYDLDVESQKKVTYLLAAYRHFLRFCAPKEERGPMLAQLERALLREWQQFQPEFPVRDVLEAYLKKLFPKIDMPVFVGKVVIGKLFASGTTRGNECSC